MALLKNVSKIIQVFILQTVLNAYGPILQANKARSERIGQYLAPCLACTIENNDQVQPHFAQLHVQ